MAVAVRADFLGRLIAYPPLKAALDTGPFTVGPVTEAELRQAINGPAVEAGLIVEPALADTVITELREKTDGRLGSGVLPLMSQAMAATWEHRENSKLTLRGYQRAGGVADAVNKSAQDAYDTLTGPQKEAARLVFTQLTNLTADGQLVRRSCRRTSLHSPAPQITADIDAVIDHSPAPQITADIDAVIDVFSARRLLILGADGTVEICHDVLLQAWKQLLEWLGDDQVDRALYSQVRTDADTWDEKGQDSSYLYRAGRLATIDAATRRWREMPDRYPALPGIGKFLDASNRAKRRAVRWRRGLTAGLLALTLAAATAAGVAVHNAGNADRQHAVALSRQLAADSLAIDSAAPVTARQLAVAAWRVDPTSQAYAAMQAGLLEQQEHGMLPVTSHPIVTGPVGLAYSPDGTLLATAGGDSSTVQLWNPATGQPAARPIQTSQHGDVTAMAFSPGSTLLATAGGDGTIRLWNPATGQPTGRPIQTSQQGVAGMAFSPGGKLLATAGGDGTIRLWNPATGQPASLPMRAGQQSEVLAVTFQPGGGTLAAVAAADGTIRLRNPATGRPASAPIRPSSPLILGVAFSPGGKQLATNASLDGTVQVWNPVTGKATGPPIQTGQDGLDGLAFSPDGKQLATIGVDGTIRLWDPANGEPDSLGIVTSGPGSMQSMAFSPGGTLLATAGTDGTVRLWNPTTIKPAWPAHPNQ